MKVRTSIWIEKELLKQAKERRFNVSFLTEKAIKELSQHVHLFKCECGRSE